MTSVRNAVAQQQNARPTTVAQAIALVQPELARALPKHLDADRMARLALTLVRKDRNLAECSPESFAGALLTAASLGLEPGVNGEAYLVAYKRECTLIVGYQGLAKLYFQHPLAQHLDAQTVYENDEFDYAYGLDPFLTHKPAKGDRGAVVAYYAVAKLTTGAKAFVVLSPAEVKALRGGNVGPSGKIPDPQKWMERKTALRQLVKLLPKSTQLNQALAVDERPGRELHAELVEQHRQIEAHPAAPAGVDQTTGEAGPDYQGGPTLSGRVLGPEPITEDQSKKLHALLGRAGLRDRDTYLAYISEQVHRKVTTSDDLTKVEASVVIESLVEIEEPAFVEEIPTEETPEPEWA